jgi:hypothetical protein
LSGRAGRQRNGTGGASRRQPAPSGILPLRSMHAAGERDGRPMTASGRQSPPKAQRP